MVLKTSTLISYIKYKSPNWLEDDSFYVILTNEVRKNRINKATVTLLIITLLSKSSPLRLRIFL